MSIKIYDAELDDLRVVTQEDIDRQMRWINIHARNERLQQYMREYMHAAYLQDQFHNFVLILTEAEMQLQRLLKIEHLPD